MKPLGVVFLLLLFATAVVVFLNTKVSTNSPEIPSKEYLRKPTVPILKKTIAYAITVTKDGPFVDGAIVLGYSALKVHDRSLGYKSNYNAELVAFVVPSVVTSRPLLESHGWKIIERPLPVSLDEIENKDYANKVVRSRVRTVRSFDDCLADEG
jgi:hypothetical protein